ncbi:MAG: hypothetical protein HY898_00505 [Deltaproteobacteria bacterium]|nr:hypothetical protein [Deltaproteobacteria bacterium]
MSARLACFITRAVKLLVAAFAFLGALASCGGARAPAPPPAHTPTAATSRPSDSPHVATARKLLEMSIKDPASLPSTHSVMLIGPALWHAIRSADPSLANVRTRTVFHTENGGEYDTRTLADADVARVLGSAPFQTLARTLLKGRFRPDTPKERSAVMYTSPGNIPTDSPIVVIESGQVLLALILDGEHVVWIEDIGPWMRHTPPPTMASETPAAPQAPTSAPPTTTVTLTEVHSDGNPDDFTRELDPKELIELAALIAAHLESALRDHGVRVSGSWFVVVQLCPQGISTLATEDPLPGMPKGLGGVIVNRLPRMWPRTRSSTLELKLVYKLEAVGK